MTPQRQAELFAEMVAALKAAERCLQSIERNQEVFVDYITKVNPGAGAATVQTFEGWKRNLNKARAVLAAVDKERK